MCFGDGRSAALVVHRLGSGLVVTVASVQPFVNQALGRGDDAQLAATLLAPSPGTRVRVMDANQHFSTTDVGDGTVVGALPRRARQGVLQLAIAFVVWALVRGRRLGAVVPEELPVPVPGSDLVLAVGELLARGDDLGDVAERLRRRARRELGVAVGLGADPEPVALVAALSDHVATDPLALRRALIDPVSDVDALVDVTRHLDRLRKDLHATRAPA